MSKPLYKAYVCEECGILMDPIELTSNSQHAYEVNNKRLKKTKHVVAMCENSHIGVFPFYKTVKTYLSKMKDGIPFFMDSTKWIEEYMEDPDSYGLAKTLRLKNPSLKNSLKISRA